jgi:sensor histidine kinase YesM
LKTFTKIVVLFFYCTCFLSNAQVQNIKHFFIDKNQSNITVNDITQDNIGYLWQATEAGLYQYDGISFTQKTTENCKTIFAKNDTLFAGTESELLVFTNEELTTFKSKSIQKIVQINDTIYLGTTQGIAIYKNSTITPLKINNAIDFAVINDILKVGNCIYIASNNGLWTFKSSEKFKKLRKISDNSFSKLIENRKHILALNSKGIIEVIMNNKSIDTITSKIIINDLFKIDNEIWITTNGFGIYIYNANDYSFERKINKYNSTISDKLTTIYLDKDKTIWLGTHKNGLFKIYKKNNSINQKPTLKLNSVTINFNKVTIDNISKLQLSSKENNISFSYKTVSLTHANEIKYRYKLNGSYSNWSKSNTIDFANLKAATYQFYAQSKIGNQLSNEIYIPFVIDLPFYKKGWFYLLSATVFFGLLFLILELRFQKKQKENQQKIKDLQLQNHLISLEQKALQLQMNPHFIFNVLNGIKAFGNNGEIATMNETISQFSVLLRSILNNSRIEEISLKEEINVIENYLILEQKINPKSFKYHIKTALNTIDIEEILVPPMLVQPFIENSIKHGFQPNKNNNIITILFEIKHRFLHCTIIDNGIGFHQTKKQNNNKIHKSVALEITRERIINLSSKHSFSIEEVITHTIVCGTKVWFKIPLKTDY